MRKYFSALVFSHLIPNIFFSIPASDLGALTTTIFTTLHLRYNSIRTPIAINNMHSTNTRKLDGNTTPKRIPAAKAIAHITYKLPLLWHIASHRLSCVFTISYAGSKAWVSCPVSLYLSKRALSSCTELLISAITLFAAALFVRSTPVAFNRLIG